MTSQRKKKLLILTNCIPEYRISVYNLLAESFELTVGHYGKEIISVGLKFKQIILIPKKCGPFITLKKNVSKIALNYDAVIAMGDLHVLPYMKLGFSKRRPFSLTYWTIGVSAFYNKRFDEDRRFDKIRFRLMNNADSLVFYSDYPISRYTEDGKIKRDKLFVANNTVEIAQKIIIPSFKKYFLFVGTLYKAKGIFELLEAYREAEITNNAIQPLIIIGEGPELLNIERWIIEQDLSDKIVLKGAIFDQNILAEIYRDAIACISPGQAGLTVLNAMAYGVPFVTTQNAITGGEIFNIINGINGIIYQGKSEQLCQILLEFSCNQNKVYSLSVNAQEYYFKNRTVSIMVQGLKDAINYALSIRTE